MSSRLDKLRESAISQARVALVGNYMTKDGVAASVIPAGYRVVREGEVIERSDRWWYPDAPTSVGDQFVGTVLRHAAHMVLLLRRKT